MRGGFAMASMFSLSRIYPSSVGFADSFPPRGKHKAGAVAATAERGAIRGSLPTASAGVVPADG